MTTETETNAIEDTAATVVEATLLLGDIEQQASRVHRLGDNRPTFIDLVAADPTLRLGTLCETWPGYGLIQRHVQREGLAPVYYAWPDGDGRGYVCMTLNAARNRLGVQPRCGYSDIQNTTRLGRLVEKGPLGEIYKHVLINHTAVAEYYVWLVDQTEAMVASSFAQAREWAGVVLPVGPAKVAKPAKAKAKK